MPPRSRPLPPALTTSAKAAQSAFYCALCEKQYTRQNELTNHESSYDHLHKKRLKEMRALQQSMGPRTRDEGGGVVKKISVQLGGAKKSGAVGEGRGGRDGVGGKAEGGGGGFKKGGFKNAFAPAEEAQVDEREDKREQGKEDVEMEVEDDSDVTDQEDYYDPRRPTGCMPDCPGRKTLAKG